MKSFAFLTGVLVVFSVQAFCFGYYDSITNGTLVPGLSPLQAALGSVRAVGTCEPVSIFLNPAQTAFLPLSLQLSGSSIQWSESVSESDVEKATRTMMSNDNGTAAFVWRAGTLAIGAGIAKVAEFGYEGTHVVSADSDYLQQSLAILTSNGSQWEMLGSVSAIVSGYLSAGFSGGVRTAAADYSYSFTSQEFGIPDSSAEWSFEETEFAWHAGLALNGEMFKSGVSYSSGTSRMEDIIALGGSALAPHINNTTVGFEAEVTSPFDSNRFMGKLFVKMPLTGDLNAVTSVSFDDNRVADRAGLGFGLGFDFRINRLSVGGSVLNRFKARRNTAFPDEQSDRVDDSATEFVFGIAYMLGD